MAKPKSNSPLLGYNTNVRHLGKLFHIQTEDSGIEHPHIITHLFTEGTILATKKISYGDKLNVEDIENTVRQLMREQHKTMFIELRDGVHDPVTAQIFGDSSEVKLSPDEVAKGSEPTTQIVVESSESEADIGVQIINPASMDTSSKPAPASEDTSDKELSGRSIFDTPDEDGDFGESMITDKSLDEVILSYLTEELDE